MKKALSLILALVMCLSLCSCGNSSETSKMGKDEIIIETTYAAGQEFKTPHYQMPDAYFVNDKMKVTGTLLHRSDDKQDYCTIGLDKFTTTFRVYFTESVDVSKLVENERITFVAKYGFSGSKGYYDAEIID
ncbi:MAG: hypothetical protein IJY28_09045 [Clostridia bacterium]|nr:hypothetical protein [Clostridia bacterium]